MLKTYEIFVKPVGSKTYSYWTTSKWKSLKDVRQHMQYVAQVRFGDKVKIRAELVAI